MGGDVLVSRFIMLARVELRRRVEFHRPVQFHRKVRRPVAVGAASITPDRARRPTTITSRKVVRAPSLVAAEAKQFTLVRPWCNNARRIIRLPIIRRPIIKRRHETTQRRVIRPREITHHRVIRRRVALRVSMAAVVEALPLSTVVAVAAAARRPSTVVEAVETVVAVVDPAAVVAATAEVAVVVTVRV